MYSSSIAHRRSSTHSFFVSSCLVSAAMAMPHAILTPLLLNKGMTLPQITVMQALFSLVILLTEFPSGVIADLVNRKTLYIASKIILAVFFLMVFAGTGPVILMIAWGIYALSASLNSGTLDAALVNNAKATALDQRQAAQRISWLVGRSSQIDISGMIIGGTLGGILYTTIGYNIYLISALLAVLSIISVLLWFQIPETHVKRERHNTTSLQLFRSHISESFHTVRESSTVQFYIVLMTVLQCIIQIHFQLWQGSFLDKGLSENTFLFLYLTFQAIGFLAGFLSKQSRFARFLFAHPFLISIPILLFLYASLMSTGIASLIPYSAFIFICTIIVNSCRAGINEAAPMEKIGAITSLSSALSRLGGILSLCSMAVALHYASAGIVVPIGLAAFWCCAAAVIVIGYQSTQLAH
ncbi:MFS transporter [Corynebacterium sp. sy039]|nr:MFS transporter [Corynebacterium sp. sy039]